MQDSRLTTFPIPVKQITDWWLPRIEKILRSSIKGVFLTGSVVLGDYCEGWSDVDVCVVVEGGVPEGIAPTLRSLHDEMRDTFQRKPDWKSGQFLEGYYISSELATGLVDECWCYVVGGATDKHSYGNPLSPFDRYMLSHHTVILAGEPVDFAPPSVDELAKQAYEDLRSLSEFEGHSGIWLCGMLHWLARSTEFWRNGVMLGKSQALRTEIERGSHFSEAYRLALEARFQGSAHAGTFHDRLLMMYPEMVPKAQTEMAEYIDSAVRDGVDLTT